MLVVAPTGSGKTLAAFLAALDQLASTPPPADPEEALPRAVRVPAQGPRGRRGAQSPQPADRHPPGVRAPGAARAGGEGRHPLRRHPARRAPRPVHPPAGHPDHHPGVAVPDADVGHARRADRHRDGDPGRGARGRGHQARRPSRALPGAAGRAAAEARPAASACRRRSARSTRWPAISPRSRKVEIVQPPSGKEFDLSVVVPVEDLGELGGSPVADGQSEGGGAPVDLAARRGAHHRPRPGPPLHDRVRQLPPPRGAPVQPAQRDRVRAGHRRAPARGPLPGRADGRLGRGAGRPAGPRPRPPRLGLQGAARPGRGGPQGGPAARRGRHLQPRTGHRHGRGRPGRPGRVAALRGLRPAARGPRGPPGGRGLHRRRLPEVPRRPGPGGRRHRADAHRLHRVPAASPPTPWTCWPSSSWR